MVGFTSDFGEGQSTYQIFQNYSQFASSTKDPIRAKMGAVASALTEQLQSADPSTTSPSSSAYFAITITTLLSPTAESYRLELLKLLIISLPETSTSLLQKHENSVR